MKLNTKTKSLKLHDSYKDSSKGNVVVLNFLTTDYSLDELKMIFSDKNEIMTMYKFTDSDILVTYYVNYTELIMSGTRTVKITDIENRTIPITDSNGDVSDTIIAVPIEKECEVITIELKYTDPTEELIKQNRADIDYIALMTGTDL